MTSDLYSAAELKATKALPKRLRQKIVKEATYVLRKKMEKKKLFYSR